MSWQNVETVLRVFDAFRRRDADAMFAAYRPDVEWNMDGYQNWPGARAYRGHEGIRTFFRDWLQDLEAYEAQALDPLDLGDRVLITVHDRGRGKGSGVPIERRHAQVWTMREGLAARIEVFESREAALDAVGASLA